MLCLVATISCELCSLGILFCRFPSCMDRQNNVSEGEKVKLAELEKLREYFGKQVKLYHRAVSNIYMYEGELLPFNQGRVELRISKPHETSHGFMSSGVRSFGYNHIVKIEPLSQKALEEVKK